MVMVRELLPLEPTNMWVDEGIMTPTETEVGDEVLVRRPKLPEKSGNLRLDLLPLPDGVLVSVHPPEAPSKKLNHVPCDIVLVIDVSGSMNTEAPAPTEIAFEMERNGLTVLDLTKHGALTILESLDENDRLGLVTFSDDAKRIQTLLPMTVENKQVARTNIEGLQPEGLTNLWHGILKGIEVCGSRQDRNRASAIMILTDGLPNQSCPPQGYVPKLRTYKTHATIHTFGFGYSLRSGLLKSIAEVGGGNYAFIPDASLLGTVFIHAIANLQSTFATSATLNISTPNGLKFEETLGDYVYKDKKKPDEQDRCGDAVSHLNISLGNLQYGQSRDILLRYANAISAEILPTTIQVQLQCDSLDESHGTVFKSCSTHDAKSLQQELVSYHRSRSMICSFLSTIAPLSRIEEHTPISDDDILCTKRQELETLIAELPSCHAKDELNQSLIEDLSGEIRLALESRYFQRWGVHFLLSIQGAHAKQLCNSFKDPGPLQYSRNSPLFIKCRDELDRLFDTLPPPKPSIKLQYESYNATPAQAAPVSMKSYNNKDSTCFAAECLVRLMNGAEVAVSTLRSGEEVWTPRGGRKVAAIVATTVKGQEMCKIGQLVITPWHPICIDQIWIFPAELANSLMVLYTGVVYSALLQSDPADEAHVVEVGGCLAATLGHGVTRAAGDGTYDARVHAFFGDYGKVWESLKSLSVNDGVLESEGVRRDEETGLVDGFLGPSRETCGAFSRL